MIKNKHFFFLLIMLLMPFLHGLQAQNRTLTSENKKAIELYEKGQRLVQEMKYAPAISAFEQAIKKDGKFAEAYLKLGNVYRLIGEKTHARDAYAKGFSLSEVSDLFGQEHFFYAEYLLLMGEYTEADKHLKAFRESRLPNKQLLKKAESIGRDIEFAVEAVKKPVAFTPVRLPDNLNRFSQQYFPTVTADEKYFLYTGRLKTDLDEDIYISSKTEKGWSDPKPIEEINLPEINEGAASISGDGKTLVFTSCVRKDSYGGCDLYVSYRKGGKWSAPKNLGKFVNSSSWDSQPSLSADGRTLYFTSKRYGGLGGIDIWVSTRNEKDEWQKPENAGPVINTPADDSSPYFHASGSTLYFASEGHPGMGGSDVYRSDLSENGWEKPVNLGYPLNTSHHESTIFIDAANRKGYFSKQLAGSVTVELYEFDVPDEWKSKVRAVYAKGNVYNSKTKTPIGAFIDLFSLDKGDRVSSVVSDSISGEYVVVLNEGRQYGMYATAPGFMPRSLQFDYTTKKEFNPTTLDIYLNPIEKGAAIVLQNLFFGSNEFTLEEKSKTELSQVVQFLKNNLEVNIEISGFTDDVGSDAANKILSDKRAKAVQQHLIKEGIDKARVVAKGYGEKNPAVQNTSDENRAQNRRIEMKII